MIEPDLALEAAVLRAVARAIEPYEAEIRQLKAEIRQLEAEAARSALFAEEDRKRLAAAVKDDAERQAAEAAEKIVNRILKSLGIDAENPAEFRRRLDWLVEWMEAIGSAKRHSVTVLVTTIAGGILALLWSAFKGSLLKP